MVPGAKRSNPAKPGGPEETLAFRPGSFILIAMPVEAICRRYWYIPDTKKKIFFLGAGYSTVLTWWAFPGHWYLIFIVNPLTIRWILGLTILSSRQ